MGSARAVTSSQASHAGRAQSITAQLAASFTPRLTACGAEGQQLPQHPSKVLSTQSPSASHCAGGGGRLIHGPGATSPSRLKVTSARSMRSSLFSCELRNLRHFFWN